MTKKKSRAKKIWTGIAIAAGALLLFGDPIKKALGISGISQDDLDRIKILKDIGYFSSESRDPHFQRELSKAIQRLREMQSRRVGLDVKQEVEEVVEMINSGSDYIENAAIWMIEGSYGYEFYALTRTWLSNLNTSGPKRLQNSWESFIKGVIQTVILIEWPSLNQGQLTKIWKLVDPQANERFLEKAKENIADILITNSDYFQN